MLLPHIHFFLILHIKIADLKLLFFDFGSGEIMLVVLAILLVLGPGKIPEIARTIGKYVGDIKKASDEIKTEINREANRQERDKKLEEYKKRTENNDVSSEEETDSPHQ